MTETNEIQTKDEADLIQTAGELEHVITEHPEDKILEYFRFRHLKSETLMNMSAAFAELAMGIVGTSPRCAERSVALRKLLEGKDAAVRAMLP